MNRYPLESYSSLTTRLPKYQSPNFSQEEVETALLTVYTLYSALIYKLETVVQQQAHDFAICHHLEISCYQKMGWPSAPTEISSRNDSVKFRGQENGLLQTECGRNLNTLLVQNSANIYAKKRTKNCCSFT